MAGWRVPTTSSCACSRGPLAIHISDYSIEAALEKRASSVLYAARGPGGGPGVLIKTLPGANPPARDVQRMEREYRLLRDFDGCAGVLPVHALLRHGHGVPAILSPASGALLSRLIADGAHLEWPLDRIVRLAIRLAEALNAVHGHGMAHKNVAPRSIAVDTADWSVRLLNFEIATVLSRERQERRISRYLEGSLPYISPEQTGRISQDVDHRSDFYSLGMVIYELISGRHPFEASSTLEWVHAHIGRTPHPPGAEGRPVPRPLAEMVLRLIAKNPEDRYQSSYGLLRDLRECERQLALTGRIAPFPIARDDVTETFRVPQALVGRDAEQAELLRLFERVRGGASEICLISGYSGIGKSALVDALQDPVLRARGYFLRGKFEQFKRATPYAAISAAVSGLVREWLTEPSERLAFWRDTLTDALGANLRALVDLAPELERIVGPQPPLAALPPTESQNRLQIVFRNFVRAAARPGHPILLYLDDLQWSDAPTLSLIENLATARDVGHLLILGAYRSNEVDAGHGLTLVRDAIARARPMRELALGPLDRRAVGRIAAAALSADAGDVAELSDLLYRKTEGNPFFIRELLHAFADEALIRFDREAGRWTWDMERIRAAEIAGGVVEFLLGNLGRLPGETRDALRLGACIGAEFDLRTLAAVHGRSLAKVGAALMPALQRNIILPLDDSYQVFERAEEGTAFGDANPRFRFQHDRLHQAAYELSAEDERRRIHLGIGRLLARGLDAAADGDGIIRVVRHLNEARALIDDADERARLVALNLAAARLAHDASAYPAALDYLEIARGLLPADAWRSVYGTSREISRLYAQTAYLNGLHESSEAELDTALAHVRTPLEKAQILAMRTRHYSTLGRMTDSIATALQGLALLGIDIGDDLTEEVVAAELAAVNRNLASRKIADLIEEDRLTDETAAAAIGLLMEIFPAAFLSGAGGLFRFLIARSVNLSLRHGNSTETAFAYATYGMLLCGALNDPRQGYEFGKLALAMNERFDEIGLKSRIIYVYGMFIHHWSNHWSTLTAWFRRGIEAGYQSGDLLYLAYSAQDCVIWDPRLDVDTAIAEQRRYLDIVRDCKYQDSLDSGTLFLQMLLNFAGHTSDPYSLNDESFDEGACRAEMLRRRFMTGIANHHIYKLEIHFLYGDLDGALAHVAAQDRLVDSVMSLPQLARFRFVSFLALAMRLPALPEAERQATRARLDRDLAQMAVWAGNCAENFGHLHLAMAGQLAFADGDALGALTRLGQAAREARRHGFLRDEAMITERCAAIFGSLGLEPAASAYLTAARTLYARWGAARKVAMIDAARPDLAAQAARAAALPAGSGGAGEDGEEREALAAMDLATVMKAARAISGERVLSSLLSRTMEIMLESAGARCGVFARPGGDGGDRLVVEIASAVEGAPRTGGPGERDIALQAPLSILVYALRTGSAVVLEDAAADPRYAADPYVAAHGARSVLCVPVVRSDRVEGVIYLENDLVRGAFTQDRVALVELLAAQAAISIENARFYVQLEQKVAERTAALAQKSTALEAVANQLSKYLAPQLYRSIFDQRKEVRLTSERKRLTVFFSDLVGFTELADRLESEDLTQLLNRYLTEMAEIALAHGATIDKFVGDGIVAFFGDPETRGVAADATACVRMAIAMRERLAELRAIWAAQGISKPLQCRIGIHTGYCTVGNFGGEMRMDYTIIGGTVNLASRLESSAEPDRILISYETYAHVRDEIDCVERGSLQARGIAHPLRVFDVVGLRAAAGDGTEALNERTPHLALSLDPSRMTPEERRAALDALRRAAARLEDPGEPATPFPGADRP